MLEEIQPGNGLVCLEESKHALLYAVKTSIHFVFPLLLSVHFVYTLHHFKVQL